MKKNRIKKCCRSGLFILAGFILSLSGCQGQMEPALEGSPIQSGVDTHDTTEKPDGRKKLEDKEILREAEIAAGLYEKIYREARSSQALDSLATKDKILKKLGDAGYSAVDWDNQLDMYNFKSMQDFCTRAVQGESGDTVLLRLLDDGGLIWYSLKSGKKELKIDRYAVSWVNGTSAASYLDTFTACTWNYTEKGYLLFEKYQPPGYDGPTGHHAVRIEPLDQECRELNRKYILPIGYEDNNLFLTDWSENDYGELSFEDLYEKLYEIEHGRRADAHDDEIRVTQQEFAEVMQPWFRVDEAVLLIMSAFDADEGSYKWKVRGMGDFPSCILPVPETTSYRDNGDGTLTLKVEAVWEDENTDCAFTHEVTVRPERDEKFQYVSNHILPTPDQKIPPYIKRKGE